MTTLFDRPDVRPATHALVVGVGAYRHVDDDQRPRVRALGLSRLTSPPISARCFADWLVAEHNNQAAPLGSVELLLSAPDQRYRSPDGRIDLQVEAATMANFTRAWDLWFARCDRDRGNVAIFFFSGHGLFKSHLALLMEDFGEIEHRMFENAVDFDENHQAMMTACRARVQCFFGDACRQVPYQALEREKVEGKLLVDRMVTQNQAEDAPRFYATPPTDPAYGLSNQPTLFTQALLRALRGAGSSPFRGQWIVSSGRLQEGIREGMRRLQRDPELPRQRPLVGGESSGESVLHVLRGAPSVPVVVNLKPAEAAARARLSIVSLADPGMRADRQFAPGLWEVELAAGDYDGAALFPNGDFRDYRGRVTSYPPVVDLEWEVGGTLG